MQLAEASFYTSTVNLAQRGIGLNEKDIKSGRKGHSILWKEHFRFCVSFLRKQAKHKLPQELELYSLLNKMILKAYNFKAYILDKCCLVVFTILRVDDFAWLRDTSDNFCRLPILILYLMFPGLEHPISCAIRKLIYKVLSYSTFINLKGLDWKAWVHEGWNQENDLFRN